MNKNIIDEFESGMECAQIYGNIIIDKWTKKMAANKNIGIRRLAFYRGYLFQRGIF